MENRLKTGAFCCKCGGEDIVKEISDYLNTTPEIDFVAEHDDLCSDEGRKYLHQEIVGNGLERILIAGCSPLKTEEPFRKTLKEAGVNPYLMAQANIVQGGIEEVASACRRLKYLEPIEKDEISISPGVMVVGGGAAGLLAASRLADMGHRVVLISAFEKIVEQDFPEDPQDMPYEWGPDLIQKVAKSDLIEIYTSSVVNNVSGQVGNFRVEIALLNGENSSCELKKESFRVGAVVAANGCRRRFPAEYFEGLEIGAEVTTFFRFNDLISRLKDTPPPDDGFNIVFMLREEDEKTEFSFRAALEAAVKARKLLKCELYVLCRNAKVAAPGSEEIYRWAREQGIVFIKYDTPPNIIQKEVPRTYRSQKERFYPLEITVCGESFVEAPISENQDLEQTEVCGSQIKLDCDYLVLNEELQPAEGTEELADKLNIETNAEGFLQQDNINLLPVLSSRRGLFIAGACRGVFTAERLLSDADNVVLLVDALLSEDKMKVDWNTASVVSEKCVLCLTCVRSCPHGAVTIDEQNDAASVQREACQSCGICASECPADAIQLEHFTDDQILSSLEVVRGLDDDGK